MRRGTKIALALGAAFLLLSGVAGAKGKAITVTSSTGKKQAKHSTYEGDVAAWARARYKLAHDYFQNYWSTALDADGIKDAALSVLAQWSLETFGGSAEYNSNVGNLKAVGSQPWFSLGDYNPKTGGKGTYQFASYDSLQDGVNAYFRLLESAYYKDCLDLLIGKPAQPDWFTCLGQKGYYAKTIKDPKTGKEKDNLVPAAAGWAARRALLAQYATAVPVVGDDTWVHVPKGTQFYADREMTKPIMLAPADLDADIIVGEKKTATAAAVPVAAKPGAWGLNQKVYVAKKDVTTSGDEGDE